MKTINILGFNRQQIDRLIQEVLILARLHHHDIVKLYEVYETPKAIYLIQELLSGGELYTRLVNSPCSIWKGRWRVVGKFSEGYAKGIIKSINDICFPETSTKVDPAPTTSPYLFNSSDLEKMK